MGQTIKEIKAMQLMEEKWPRIDATISNFVLTPPPPPPHTTRPDIGIEQQYLSAMDEISHTTTTTTDQHPCMQIRQPARFIANIHKRHF